MLDLFTGLHAVAMLAVVLALIVGLGWLLRTYGSRLGLTAAPSGAGLKVVQRLPLTAQHTLVEVADAETRYVVILSPQSSQVIDKINLKSQSSRKK